MKNETQLTICFDKYFADLVVIHDKKLVKTYQAIEKTKQALIEMRETYLVPELWEHTVIAGGIIPYLIDKYTNNREYSYKNCYEYTDIDVWVHTKPSMDVARKQRQHVREYTGFPVTDIAQNRAKYGAGIFNKKHAFTFSLWMGAEVQIIPFYVDHPSHVPQRFDFLHLDSYFDCATGELIMGKKAIDYIISKKLVLNEKEPNCAKLIDFFASNGRFPHDYESVDGIPPKELKISLERIKKYKSKGYKYE